MPILYNILMEISPEKTATLILILIFVFLLFIAITICFCEMRHKGIKAEYILAIILFVFLLWLAYNTVSSLIHDFIFYSTYY